jgi:hypothetical protein
MSLDNPRRTILDELLRQETGLPGEQRMKMRKNIFPELEGDNWVENACGNIYSQPAASDVFPRNDFARRPSLCNPLGLPPQQRLIQWTVGVGGTKISDDIFQTWQIQQPYIEF